MFRCSKLCFIPALWFITGPVTEEIALNLLMITKVKREFCHEITIPIVINCCVVCSKSSIVYYFEDTLSLVLAQFCSYCNAGVDGFML